MKDKIKRLITANEYDLAEQLCKGQGISLVECLQETDRLKAYIKHKLQGKDKKYCVKFAVFCAELVLPVWVEKYPNDDRPAKAVKAAKVWIETQTRGDYSAAYAAANAAYAAADAASAAYAAADAAAASASSAYAVSAAADYAAADAVSAAASAAYADKSVLDNIVNYLNE